MTDNPWRKRNLQQLEEARAVLRAARAAALNPDTADDELEDEPGAGDPC